MLFTEGSGLSQSANDVPRTSAEVTLKVVTSWTYRGPSGEHQETNTKTNDLMKKLFFRSNRPCITYFWLFFYRKNKYLKVLNRGVFTGPSCWIVGGPGDQMMGRFRDVCGTSIKHVFYIQLINTLNLL